MYALVIEICSFIELVIILRTAKLLIAPSWSTPQISIIFIGCVRPTQLLWYCSIAKVTVTQAFPFEYDNKVSCSSDGNKEVTKRKL